MDLSCIFLAPLWILCSLWRLWQRFSHATTYVSAHNVRSLPGTMIYLIRGALCSKLEPLKCNHGNDLWNLLAYIVIIIIIIIFPSASFKLAHIVSFIDSNFSEICWIFSNLISLVSESCKVASRKGRLVQVNLCQNLFFLQNMGRTCCVQTLFWMSETISVHNMFSPGLSLEFSCIELVIQWTICCHILG